MHKLPTLELLGVPVVSATAADAVARILDLATGGDDSSLVAFVNAHSLRLAVHDDEYRGVLRGAAFVLNDGIGVSMAAWLGGHRFPANLNGSDLIPMILQMAAEAGLRVFFLGARPGVAESAALEIAKSIPGFEVVGTRHGHYCPEELDSVVAQIRAARTDVLIVAMGNPIQEKWLAQHLAATGARVGVAAGAFLDFASGNIVRAPRFFRVLRLEWLFRLCREPKRLSNRYLIGGPEFMIRTTGEALRKLGRKG